MGILKRSGALLALAFGAMAAGAHADSVAHSGSPFLPLQTVAAVARYRLAIRADRYLQSLDPGSRKKLMRALTSPGRNATPWGVLLRGALQVRHESGELGETVWFNPVFDAGLLVRWQLATDGWRVSDAWWVLGTDVREQAAAARPLVLPIGVAPTPDVFELAPFPLMAAADWRAPGPSSRRQAEVARRVNAAVAAVNRLTAEPGLGPDIWRTRDLMVLPSSVPGVSIDPDTARALLAVGRTARATMRPVSAYVESDGTWWLLLQSADAPGVTFEVALEPRTARLQSLQAFRYGRSTEGSSP
jgi:hypothetical protein